MHVVLTSLNGDDPSNRVLGCASEIDKRFARFASAQDAEAMKVPEYVSDVVHKEQMELTSETESSLVSLYSFLDTLG